MVYGIQKRGSGGGSSGAQQSCKRIATVKAMQVGGEMTGWLTSARKLWSERISCKAQMTTVFSGYVRNTNMDIPGGGPNGI